MLRCSVLRCSVLRCSVLRCSQCSGVDSVEVSFVPHHRPATRYSGSGPTVVNYEVAEAPNQSSFYVSVCLCVCVCVCVCVSVSVFLCVCVCVYATLHSVVRQMCFR